MQNGKKTLFLTAALAALILFTRSVRTDLGDLSDAFYRRLFQYEKIRTVFHMEEEDVQSVFAPETEARQVFAAISENMPG